MHSITLIGLGPSSPQRMTVEAERFLKGEPGRVVLRTAEHPAVAFLRDNGIPYESFDSLYAEASDYDALYEEMAGRIIAAAADGPVAYCLPGNPYILETSVRKLLGNLPSGADVRVIPGLSYLDEVAGILPADICELRLRLLDAHDIDATLLDGSENLLIAQPSDRLAVSDLKLALLEAYPPEQIVTLMDGQGGAGTELPLAEIDHADTFSQTASLFVPAASPGAAARLSSFLAEIAMLRGPQGCPWDREQDHISLRPFLLEETYEVLEAIEGGDPQELCAELGDLFLQIALHVRIAEEAGEFDMADVIAGIAAKIRRRHPHVFGDELAGDAAEVVAIWHRAKEEEKGDEGRGLFDGVPTALPALHLAEKIQARAASIGFDWETTGGIIEKVAEEAGELRQDLLAGRDPAEELGDLFFSLVNLSRALGVDAESAMRASAGKFRRRLEKAMLLAAGEGREFAALSLDEKEAFWQKAKALDGEAEDGSQRV